MVLLIFKSEWQVSPIQKLLFKIIIRRSVEINKHQVVLIIPPQPPNPLDHQAVLLESGTASAIQNFDEGLERLENNQKVNITNLIGHLRASLFEDMQRGETCLTKADCNSNLCC